MHWFFIATSKKKEGSLHTDRPLFELPEKQRELPEHWNSMPWTIFLFCLAMFYMRHKGHEKAAKVVNFAAKWLNLYPTTVREDVKNQFQFKTHESKSIWALSHGKNCQIAGQLWKLSLYIHFVNRVLFYLAVKEPGSLTTEQDGIKKYNVGTKQNPNICSDSLHSISIPYKKRIIDRRPTMQTK